MLTSTPPRVSGSVESVITECTRPSMATPPEIPSSPAEEIFQAYLAAHKRSVNTRGSYRNTMNRLADFMEIPTRAEALQRLLGLSEEDANGVAGRFLAHLKARGFSKNSIATKIAALTGFTRYAKSVGAIGWAVTFSATGRPRKNLRELVTDKIGPIRDIQGDGSEAQAARIICQLEALKPSENSRRAYRQTLRHFSVFLKKDRLEEALAYLLALSRGKANSLAMDYRTWMAEAKLSTATIAQRLAILRGYCFHAYDTGAVEWRISIRLPRVDSYMDTSGPKPEKIADVLATLGAQQDIQSKRDCATIWMLYGMGLRASEVMSLDLAHVDLTGKRVSIKGKMREKREWRTMPEEVLEALKKWLQIRGVEKGPLFTGLARGLRLRRESLWRRTTAYGLGRPHGLRHSAITRVLDLSNGNYRKVQAFSRHRDPKTIMIYDDQRLDAGGELAALLAKDTAEFGGKAEAVQPAAEKARLTLVHDSVRKLTS